MKITYDKIADALYVYLSKKKVSRTIPVNSSVMVDLDSKGSLVGIEILNVSFQISPKELQRTIKSGVLVSV